MSVTNVILSSQGATGEVSGDTPANISVTYSCNYHVQCSDSSDSPTQVLNYFATTSSLPWMGRPFNFGNGFSQSVYCNSVKANYVANSAGKFIVTCGFKGFDGDDQQQTGKDAAGKNTNDPLKWYDEIGFTYNYIPRVAESGIFRGFTNSNGNNPYFKIDETRAVTNSANQPFDPPLERQIPIRVIRITKRSKKCNAIKAGKYIGKVNSDSFTIEKQDYGFSYPVSPYCAMMAQWSTDFVIENNVPHWRESVEVHVNPETWRRTILDQGLNRRQMDNGDKDDNGNTISASDTSTAGWTPYTSIKDKDGFPITTPIPLDGNGQPLLTSKPHCYLTYSIEGELPFSGISW